MSSQEVRNGGTFQLDGMDVWGELTFANENSVLALVASDDHDELRPAENIYGRLHHHTWISCIGCVSDSPSVAVAYDGVATTSWRIFPHYILSGNRHFRPEVDRVKRVWFSTEDIYQIFDDFDSFGTLRDPAKIAGLLPSTVGGRDVPLGAHPVAAFFGGRATLISAELSFGKFEVHHWISTESSSKGANIGAQMRVLLEFDNALELKDCFFVTGQVNQFLSLVAGRTQGIENVRVELEEPHDEGVMKGRDTAWDVHWSLRVRSVGKQELDIPSWLDMPLDGIRREQEFCHVMKNWFSSDEHALPRSRLFVSRNSGALYSPDRLVAAANMFDLMVVPLEDEIPPQLKEAQAACVAILKALPSCDERNSAIQALKRIGTPTLRRKVLARTQLLRGHFYLQDVDRMVQQAILFRNYFVHGSGDSRFKYEVVEPFMQFLTELLEFIFAASELIECGWSGSEWKKRPHTGHHWFNRFLHYYPADSAALCLALADAADSDDR